ncbi:MAG: hypothetical protein LC642_03575 [Verrucomicrobiaceae bacterium]|nr:hypothetical protein [Verrucomicrobiaceae bacterium]
MTFALVPDFIVAFHRALLAALQVDFFRPGLLEMNNWRDFLEVMKPLEDSVGGPFTAQDIAAAIQLMRAQNRSGGNWSLRYAKIMQNPEAFRDLVLIARKKIRPREPKVIETAKTGDGANVAVERDPAAERDPQHISNPLRDWRERMQKGSHDT